MSASDYQRASEIALARHFADVKLEWPIARYATDALRPDVRRYAPRVDIAIGPFNMTTRGCDPAIVDAADDLPRPFIELFRDLPPNPNPRCLLAVEVVFSGSSKHIMGDMLNAAALGFYGLVVGAEPMMPKINRIAQYVAVLARLEKLPVMFRNLVTVSTTEFDILTR